MAHHESTPRPPVSVIIPARNEAVALPATLAAVRADLPAGGEIIVVDGDSTDATTTLAARSGARVIASAPGRGVQLHAGARAARSQHLLFLHADTLLPAGWSSFVAKTLNDPAVALGAFAFRIDREGRGYRVLEWGVARRCRRHRLPYGDQGLFLRAADYHAAGGFPAWPCFEDDALVRAVRKRGRVVVGPLAAQTSGRAWAQYGRTRTTVVNWLSIQAYRVGVSPHRIARLRALVIHRPQAPPKQKPPTPSTPPDRAPTPPYPSGSL